jgi:phosphoribosylanthranilate isomerase
MRRTRIKVCGITRPEDATKAAAMGVDALGFIFADRSPRCISPEKVWKIVKQIPSFVSSVGVFVNSNIEEVKQIVDNCGLSQVQLHGDESVEYCRALKHWRRSLSVCKAFRVKSQGTGREINAYRGDVDSMLLDTYTKGTAGGTGETFDWTIIEHLDLKKPLILAGGLNPDNIVDAIRVVNPFAVDVNSGIENSPGIKSHQKMGAVFDAVREADRMRS